MRPPSLYNFGEKAPKVQIRYMVVICIHPDKYCTHNIGIYTESGKYLEYEISLRNHDITWVCAKVLRSLFNPFELTRNSEVIFNEGYDDKSPLYMYMQFIKQHIQFNLRHVHPNTILRRICVRHQAAFPNKKSSQLTYTYYNKKLWDFLVKSKACSWISQKYDYYLQDIESRYVIKAQTKRMLRMGMYYLVVKNHLDAYARKYQRQAELKAQTENTAEKSTSV